jgi:hypothetical protein
MPLWAVASGERLAVRGANYKILAEEPVAGGYLSLIDAAEERAEALAGRPGVRVALAPDGVYTDARRLGSEGVLVGYVVRAGQIAGNRVRRVNRPPDAGAD